MLQFPSGRSLALTARRRWLALGVVCLAQLMNTLDGTIVNVALPTIQADLHVSQAALTWVVNAYLIAYGSFLLLAGRLGDLLGRRPVFLAGLVVFTLASAVCGLARDHTVLVAARFVQGVGSAISSSVIVAIIVTEFTEPAARARAMSTYIFFAVGGGSIGLLLGGVLTQLVDWHWIFFINLPIGLLAALLGRALLRAEPGLGLGHGVDVLGSVLVTGALMVGIDAIVEATSYGWGSLHTLGLGGLALGLLVVFGLHQRRIRNPILPPRIVRLRGLLSSSLIRGIAASGMFSAFFLGALYLDRVLGYSPLATGLAFLPLSLTIGALSLGLTTRLVARLGAKRCTSLGLLAITAALVLLGGVDEHTAYFPRLLVAFGLIGLGAGLSFQPLLTIALAEVPPADAGLASGIVNVSMQVAAAFGLAVLGSLSSDRSGALLAAGFTPSGALLGGYQFAFWIAGACVSLGVLVAQRILRPVEAPAASQPVRLRGSQADEAPTLDAA